MTELKQIHQLRKVYDKKCPICGQSFEGFKNKIVCGATCRSRLKRLKDKEQRKI